MLIQTLFEKLKTIKSTETERILDYYICCLEQEDLKNLCLKAENTKWQY
jgi:hypothetical protein